MSYLKMVRGDDAVGYHDRGCDEAGGRPLLLG